MKKNTLRVLGVLFAAALFVSISVGAVCAGSDDNYLTWTGAYSRNAYIGDSVGPQTNEVLWFNNYTSKTPLPDSAEWDTTPYMDSTPLVYNGNLYYSVYGGTTDSGIYCVNALTGKEVWKYTDDYSKDSMTIDKGVLYVGTCRPYDKGNGSLVALDAATGAKKWSSKQLCTWGYVGISSAPVVSNDVVYLVVHDAGNTTCNDHLYAFNTTTITDGSLDVEAEWTLPLVNEGNTTGYIFKYSSPSLSPDGKTLYVPGFGGCAAVNLQSKSVDWKYDAGLTGKVSANNRVGTPVYEGGKIYLTWRNSASNNVLSVLDAANGELKASKTSTDYISSYAVAVTDSYVVTCGAKGFAVLNKEGLSEKYTLARDSGATGDGCSPLIVGNTVYYSSYSMDEATGKTKEAVLNAFSLDTGKLLWTYIFDKGSFGFAQAEATPAYSDGVIYIATQCGYIYAFYSPEILYKGTVLVYSPEPTIKDVLDIASEQGNITYNATAAGWILDICGITDRDPWYTGSWAYTYEHEGKVTYPNSILDSIPLGSTLDFTYSTYNPDTFEIIKVQKEVIITVSAQPDHELQLQQGWNFISVPKALAKPAAKYLFSPVSKSGFAPMTWDAEKKEWILVSENTQVTPLTGYWVYAEKPTTLYVVYDKDVTSVPASKRVYEGWNAVGVSGTNTMTAETAFANVDWVLAHVWNVSEGEFDVTISSTSTDQPPLPQYSGLWLYSNEDKGIPGYL